MFNFTGAMVYTSLTSIFLFLASFGFAVYLTSLYLSFNEWIHQVEHMGFLFNPSFMTWLFAKNRERWGKWTTCYCYLGSISLGPPLFLAIAAGKIPATLFDATIISSIVILSIFAYLFYLSYKTKLRTSEKQNRSH